MKTVSFSYKVITNILLTREEIDHILEMCKIHYDSTCKAAGEIGGFVYGWKNWLFDKNEVEISATFKELDLVTKILEMEQFKHTPTPLFMHFCNLCVNANQESAIVNKRAEE